MTTTFLTKTVLSLSGAIALGIGLAILTVPVAFYAQSGVALPGDVSLMNDLRAFGGGLLAVGLFILLGLLRRAFVRPSLVAGAMVYAGFAGARLWAISADGMPQATYVWVLAIELGVAILCALLAFKTR